jgi:LuxR family maltose regulon positive regulatory protein
LHELVQSLSGSHRYILDYLIEEVFQRQDPAVQDFLLRTSILDRLTAPLCDAVRFGEAEPPSGPPGTAVRQGSAEPPSGAEAVASSQAILEHLEAANLFIVPLDQERRWYRYHRLFADLLRQRLRTTATQDQITELHRRASEWFQAAGHVSDAVHHALAGADWKRASALILDLSGPMLMRGEVVTLLNWFRLLPEEEVCRDVALCLQYCWALILTGQIEAAESYLALAREAAEDNELLLADILTAEAYIARAQGDDERTIELSRQALPLLAEDNDSARSVVALNMGIALWKRGQLQEAAAALEEARQAGQRSGNHYAGLMSLVFSAMLNAAWGRLHQAAQLCRRALELGQGLPVVCLAHTVLAALLYEWNDLEAAADHLDMGIEKGKLSGNAEVQIGGYRISARLEQARGDASAAVAALEEADRLARERDVPGSELARNAACRVQIALAQGDLDVAISWSERVMGEADAWSFYPLLGVTPARILLARSRKQDAAEQLAAWHDTAIQAGWQYAVIEVRALQALAATTADEALDFLTDALTLAEPEGYVRTFVDKGEPMAVLLRKAASSGTCAHYAARVLAAFKGTPEREDRSAVPPLSPLVEPLSERELEVLPLLAAGQTYQEMAHALCVSTNTIKTHLKNIYGKLGVHNRRDAVTRARELQLLS